MATAESKAREPYAETDKLTDLICGLSDVLQNGKPLLELKNQKRALEEQVKDLKEEVGKLKAWNSSLQFTINSVHKALKDDKSLNDDKSDVTADELVYKPLVKNAGPPVGPRLRKARHCPYCMKLYALGAHSGYYKLHVAKCKQMKK